MKNAKSLIIATIMILSLVIGAGVPLMPVKAAGEVTYVLNTNSMKFHLPNCSSVSNMSSRNRLDTTMSYGEGIAAGYVPCKNCHPDRVAPRSSTASSTGTAAVSRSTPAASGQSSYSYYEDSYVPASPAYTAPAGLTAEQAVQKAFALFVQSGLDQNTAMAKVQEILPQISAQPDAYAQFVQQALASGAAAPAAVAALAAPAAAPAAAGGSAEQLIQQMFAALVAQGMTPDQAIAAINANLPAILAQANGR